ncbi:hypothetical protein EUGRSUZ_H05083 [Eucalyptus grandis]|uniref:Uncharacterized protein n=2 Tax=Eucalyptus grandis TaxID=71139 RepID=A0ACC3JZJ8_EUCGR|nr:hypothetical protein EUGRSUZ_H05083 [Eucalyptus grandis]
MVSDIQGRIKAALALKPGEGKSSQAATANVLRNKPSSLSSPMKYSSLTQHSCNTLSSTRHTLLKIITTGQHQMRNLTATKLTKSKSISDRQTMVIVSDIQGRKYSSTSSQAWRRRKLLGGHCECF